MNKPQTFISPDESCSKKFGSNKRMRGRMYVASFACLSFYVADCQRDTRVTATCPYTLLRKAETDKLGFFLSSTAFKIYICKDKIRQLNFKQFSPVFLEKRYAKRTCVGGLSSDWLTILARTTWTNSRILSLLRISNIK